MTALPGRGEAGYGSAHKIVRGQQVLIDGRLQPAVIEITHGVISAVHTGPDALSQMWPPYPHGPMAVETPPGTLMLPGNVDAHVHINEPGRTSWEGFASASTAAALGGITTLIDMPLNSIPPTIDRQALAIKQEAARTQLTTDVGMWAGAVPENLGQLEALWQEGVFGFKCFLVDSGVPEFAPLNPEQFAAAMSEIASFDGLMIVHAEDATVLGAVPEWSSRRYDDFVASRPPEAEVEAVRAVVREVERTGARAHILHVSSALVLPVLAEAKAAGLPITAETCPHYLVFDAAQVPDAAPEFKCCPPIRDGANQDELWQGLREGILDCVVSDHSPSTVEEKTRGGGDLAQAWGGVSSLQVTFPVMVDAAAERGIGIEQVSAWMAAGPARTARVPHKGAIAVGNDADLIWYEPGREITIDGQRLAHRNKLSPYHGRTLSGSVSRTMVRGRMVFDGYDLVHGTGQIVVRG